MNRKPVNKFIDATDFPVFVDGLIDSTRVVGPVAKRKKFAYADLTSAEELRLDFDVTMLPPKAVFFPPVQELLEFNGDKIESCIHPVDTVLFGVHPYDVKAIDMCDEFFSKPTADGDYLNQRAATTLVASNIQNVSPWAFWDTIGPDVAPIGMDAFLTKIEGGYVLDVYTDKGEDLLEFGTFADATSAQIGESQHVNDAVVGTCEHRLRNTGSQIADTMDERFDDKLLWEGLSDGCFSCGSCNIVCPTCFCFDVEDHWNLDQVSGYRSRCWDSCLAYDFSVTTLAGGGEENFRGEHYERFRHRFMRKMVYQKDRFEGPACVGCGRCAGSCTPGIADPVKVINTVMGVEE